MKLFKSIKMVGSATAISFMFASMLFISGTASAVPAENSAWSDWQALDSGYIARRKQPPKMNLPKSERKLARVQERMNKLSRRNERMLKRIARKEKKGEDVTELQLQVDALQTRIVQAANNNIATNNIKSNAAWLYTSGEGLNTVEVADLAVELGVSTNRVRKKANEGKLTLTNENNAAPWYFDATNDQIVFAAESYETLYTDENAYRLKLSGGKKALPIQQSGGVMAMLGTATPFTDTLQFEEEPDFFYATWAVASEPDADYWFWKTLYGKSGEVSVPLQVPNPAEAGNAQIRVTLRGFTDMQPGDEHQVSAELNGYSIGSPVIWDAFDEAVLVADFDQSLLNSTGENMLVLKNDGLGTSPSGQFLDKIEVDYIRKPVADNGSLWLHDVAAGAQSVSGFSSADIMVIESPASDDAVLRNDVHVEYDGTDYTVTFESLGGADFLVAQRSVASSPLLEADIPSNLKNKKNQADYLIIATHDFANTAEALATYRSNQYSNVKIVWLKDVYDQFSHGRVDPHALTSFMQRVNAKWQIVPNNIVLIGNGTLDHKDRMGYADSFLPTLMTDTFWALTASDDRLLGGNGDAPFAIGRLPITNDTEGVAYVNKVIAYEAATPALRRDGVLVADNPDEAGDFHTNSNILADYMIADLSFDGITKLYHSMDSVRPSLTASSTWQDAEYISYDGHGTIERIGDGKENFIGATDAAALNNTNMPIFTALTCAAGDFSQPGVRSLSGALVLNPMGGAVAAVAPTGLSLDYDAQILGNAFVYELFINSSTIGDAMRYTKVQTQGQIFGFMQRMYSVVGDPVVYAR